MLDVIIPVYSPAPFEGLTRCIQSVLSNTPDCNLIIVNSDKSQPININRGLDRAQGEYAAILDWDVYVPPGWADKLIDDLKNNDKIGIIGARMIGKYNGLNRQATALQEWPTLAGGCMVFRNIGLRWDENFPNGYWADTDFCRQYKEKGYQVWIDGGVEVEHDINTHGSGDENYYKQKWGDLNF